MRDGISGLVFSYDPILKVDTEIDGQPFRLWQIERFYIETPPGYDLTVVQGQKFVRDPREGDNVYMRAARVVSCIWQNRPGFFIVPSTDYASLDREEET